LVIIKQFFFALSYPENLETMKRFCISVLGCIILAAIILISSCSRPSGIKNSKNTGIKIERFEKDLFSISIYNLKDSIALLKSKYPRFFPLYTNKIIEIGDISQPGFNDRLLAFVSDFTIYNVSKKVATVFPDLDRLQEEMGRIFKNYSSQFPKHCVPQIFTCISGFNQSVIVSDSMLVISLDKYLGQNDEFYKLLYPPVPEYERYVMHPAKISSDAMIAWISGEFPYNDSKDNLLSRMIFQGRSIYAVKTIMPWLNDSLLWGFKPAQVDFCIKNEKQMWTFLIENKLLFSSEKLMMTKFTEEAPFTKDFSKDSPGRAAVWLGYRIVDSYIKHNRSISLQELMNNKNYLEILNSSKYNP
jgi:hypothetical protein